VPPVSQPNPQTPIFFSFLSQFKDLVNTSTTSGTFPFITITNILDAPATNNPEEINLEEETKPTVHNPEEISLDD
jgi:hypothetical protein